MVRAEKPPREREPKPQTVVVYAGKSERRLDFTEWAFPRPNFAVTNRPGGDENESHGVIAIMRQKIFSVYTRVLNEGLASPNQSLVVIGADIKIRIGTSRISRSKPDTPDETRRMLTWMSKSAYPYYSIEVGSGIKIGNAKPIMSLDTIAILLDREIIELLATPEGFAAYREDVQKYDAPPRGGSIDVTDIAAGLSFPALVANGAVSEIYHKNDHKKDSENLTFRQKVELAMCHTGVGFSPDLLRKVQPDIDKRMKSWPYLKHTTARCLGEIAT